MVANDASPMRCQMLLRRCAALGEMCSQIMVTCHPAQRFPRLPTAEVQRAVTAARAAQAATADGVVEEGGGGAVAEAAWTGDETWAEEDGWTQGGDWAEEGEG